MNVGIIGLGLIGGSLGRALVKRTNHTIFGWDNDEQSLKKAELIKAIHCVIDDSSLAMLDMIIFALPPNATIDAISECAPKLGKGCIVIDCAGVKRDIVDAMEQLQSQYRDLFFIGGHPMAGREYSGISHSSINLYDNASMIFVPVSRDIAALTSAKKFFLEAGFGRVAVTTAEEHDAIIGFTSQLAHVISSAYVLDPHASEHRGFSAGSFRDMTRVARMNADMWSDLFIANADNLVVELDCIIDNLTRYKDLIHNKKRGELREMLEKGNQTKIAIDKN